jgi:integrase
VVSVVFEYAIEEPELIDTNPVAKMKPRNKSEAYTAWSDDECERFEASKPPRFLLTTYMLCRYTGQRLGDVLAWTRGVYNGKELRFRQSKGRRHGNQEMVIPVLPPLKVYLDALPRADNTLLLVSKEDGSAYDESYVRHELRERLDACGLKRLHFHGLRHAAGRDFAEAGASVKEIMAWLGHKTPTMAIHYTQAAEQKKLAQAAGKKWVAARESNTE